MADDSIIAEYRINVANTQKALADISARLGAVEKQGKQSATGVETAFSKMGDNLTNQFRQVGASIAGAFAIDRMASFAKEAVELAGKVEGVEIAFKRLNDPQLLAKLRAATKGTVSDLNLMTAAVRANNFKIPMGQMGTLLEFARRRAKETGESIDYLVESIVVGIGRKSPLILDNLGISAIELRKRFKGISIEAADVGDVAKIVGDIATEELAKMGDEAVTTGDKIAKMTADLENFKAKAGASIIDGIKPLTDELAKTNTEISRLSNGVDVLGVFGKVVENVGKAISEPVDIFNTAVKAFNDGADEIAQSMMMVELAANGEWSALKTFIGMSNEAQNEFIKIRNGTTKSIKESTEATEQSTDAEKENVAIKQKTIYNLAFLNERLKSLKAEYDDVNRTEEQNVVTTKNIAIVQSEIDRLMGKTSKSINEQKSDFDDLTASFENGIRKYQDAQLALIDLAAERDRLLDMRTIGGGTPEQAQSLAIALNNIERNRLEQRSALLKKYGRDDLAEQQKLAQMDIDQANDNYSKMQADYERFLKGQEDDYEQSQARKQRIADAAEQRDRRRLDNEAKVRGQFFQMINAFIDLNYNLQMAAIQNEEVALEKQFKNKEITQEQYEQRQLQLRRKAAQAQKDAAVFSAITGTANAIINALQTQPFPVGLSLAALAAVIGAAQVAAIESQPLPQFEKGGYVDKKGWIKGRSHAHGGVILEAEGNEFIVNARAAAKHGPLLEAINEDRIPEPQQGWENIMKSIQLQAAFNDRNMISAIDRHRQTDRDGMKYMTDEIVRAVRSSGNSRRRWN